MPKFVVDTHDCKTRRDGVGSGSNLGRRTNKD